MTNKHVISSSMCKFRNDKQTGYPQALDNGVSAKPGRKVRLGSFADLVAFGEDPTGLKVQTPNGTSREDIQQQKTVYNVNTDRWTSNEDWDGDMSGN